MPQGMAEEKLSALNRALLDARSERMSKEVLHRQLRSLSAPQLASFPPVMASPLVQGLRTRLAELRDEEARLADTLGDRHPDLLRLRARVVALDGDLAAEIATIVRGIESEFEMARQRESNLAADLEAAKRGALSVNRKSIELAALRREVESSQQSLRELMSRTRETGLESQLRSTNLRIVEKADTPREPVFPRQTWNLQLAFFVGLAFGIGLAYVMERMDDTIRTPDDVTTGPMSLPFLGMIPEIPPTGPGVQAPLVLKEPRSAAAEAYRVLRTNLIFSSAQSKGRVIMVSSANPGEGKTTTVANLAAALAQNGARVLAVDADLRRPTMHDHFGLGHTPGLSDLIVGKCQVNDAIQGTRVSGLHVLACGYIPPNPAELLGSDNMRDLLAAQRHQFDWIFIDAPPILAMADAPVLCPIVDGLVMIVWAESSTRPALQRAVDQVHRVGGKLTGIVLNKVDLERNSYYYGQYYGEYYRKYYSEGVSSIADSAADAGTLPRQ
jgi:capsular exopolysaccharide synthesis family protein